jgi:hypothetical protein
MLSPSFDMCAMLRKTAGAHLHMSAAWAGQIGTRPKSD